MTSIRIAVLGAALAAFAAGAQAGSHGKSVYEGTCVACHGANGKGTLPGVPDLKGPLKGSDELVLKRMREGYQSPGSPMAMPPKGGNPALTDDDLKAVLAYMRKAFGR